MSEWIGTALASVRPGFSIESSTRPAEGNRKETAIVTLESGERLVLQRSVDPDALATATRLCREIDARTSIPVPSILESGLIEGHGYRVVEWIDGENLHERFLSLPDGDRRRIARRFGSALAELHRAFEFDRFGPVAATDRGLRATGPTSFGAWLDRYVEAGTDALPGTFADLEEPIRVAVGSSRTRSPTPRLFPWDLRPGNAVVDGGEIATFLDWGEPLSASAGVGLAKLDHLVADWYLDDRTELRGAIREGYRGVRSVPAVGRGERVTAILEAAVDSEGALTRPGYPERTGSEAVRFHRERLRSALESR